MFISQVNPEYTFSDKNWLVTLANQVNTNRLIPSATLFIEGVLEPTLLFARYDLTARPWQIGQKPIEGYIGYLSEIRWTEADRCNQPMQHTKMVSYITPPKLCNDLREQLRSINRVIFEEMAVITRPPPQVLLIKQDCIDWCFDLLTQLKIRLPLR